MKKLKFTMIVLALASSVAIAQTTKNTQVARGHSGKPAGTTPAQKKTLVNPETLTPTTSQPIPAPGAVIPGTTLEPAIVPGNPTYPSTIVPGNTTQPASIPEVSSPSTATNIPKEPAVVPGNPTYPAVNAPSVSENNSEIAKPNNSKSEPRKRSRKKRP